MKKIIFILCILGLTLSFSEEAITTTSGDVPPAITKEVKEEKPVNVKASIKLKISKTIPAIKNGDVAITVYEYDPFLADFPAEEVYYNDFSIKHQGGKLDTNKLFTFNIKKRKDRKYYAVVEVIDNRSLEIYRAKSTKDDIGKILEPNMSSQMFVVEE